MIATERRHARVFIDAFQQKMSGLMAERRIEKNESKEGRYTSLGLMQTQ